MGRFIDLSSRAKDKDLRLRRRTRFCTHVAAVDWIGVDD